jgi:hypothetical protein
MPADTTVSVTLPADLWFQAEEYARLQHRELREVLVDALSLYMRVDADWDSLLRRTRALGASMGIRTEADVERLSDEFRSEQRL